MSSNDDNIKLTLLRDMAGNGMIGKGTLLSYNVLSNHIGGGAVSPEKVKELCKEMEKETGSTLRQRGQVIADDLSAGLSPKAYDIMSDANPEDYNTFRSLCKAKLVDPKMSPTYDIVEIPKKKHHWTRNEKLTVIGLVIAGITGIVVPVGLWYLSQS